MVPLTLTMCLTNIPWAPGETRGCGSEEGGYNFLILKVDQWGNVDLDTGAPITEAKEGFLEEVTSQMRSELESAR